MTRCLIGVWASRVSGVAGLAVWARLRMRGRVAMLIKMSDAMSLIGGDNTISISSWLAADLNRVSFVSSYAVGNRITLRRCTIQTYGLQRVNNTRAARFIPTHA
jgi:hypothetical protein